MRLLAFAVAALALAGTALAAAPSPIDSIERGLLPAQYLEGEAQVQSITEQMLKDDVPGLSMAFIDKGEIAWQRAYGHADLATLAPVTRDTVFTGASLSKPLAAVVALQLVEEGKIDLDADVNRYLVSWKLPASEHTRDRKITLRHLIGHRAGVGNHVWRSYDTDESLPSLRNLLEGSPPATSPALALVAPPGERYQYSNPGYLAIQQLIEDVDGAPFASAARSRIFNPTGMPDSSFRQPMPERLAARRATGHGKDLAPYPYQLFPFQAAGGVWTTPADLAKFAMALINDYHTDDNALLSRAMARAVFARDPVKLGFTKHFVEGSDDIVFDHWGSNAGFTAYLVGSLEHRQALVIMSNSDNGFDLMAAIARTVASQYGWKPTRPRVFHATEIPAERLASFAGEFGSAPGSDDHLVFSMLHGRLHLVQVGDAAPRPLVPVGESTLIDPGSNTTYQFLANREGRYEWVRFTQASGYNSDLPRLETLSDFIRGRMEETAVEGLAVALVRDGKVSFEEGFGVRNSRTGEPVRTDTLFEAASLSKPVFATLVAGLAERGDFDLDRPLYETWPHPALRDDPRHRDITGRMLLAHASGLPNWPSENDGKLSLLFDPGSRFNYSGAGYEYLRGVVQTQLGLDDEGLQALVNAHIAGPAGAGFLKYTWDDAIPGRKAHGHRNGVPTDNHRHDHNFGAAYSLNTTAGDYARFISRLLRPDTPEQARISERLLELQTGLPAKPGEPHRTLGFAVKDVGGRLMYYHSGDNGDFRAYVHFFRDTGDGVVLLCNSDKLFSSGLARAIVEQLGDEWVHAP